MRRTTRNVIFSLLFALCCVFTILSTSYLRVNAIELNANYNHVYNDGEVGLIFKEDNTVDVKSVDGTIAFNCEYIKKANEETEYIELKCPEGDYNLKYVVLNDTDKTFDEYILPITYTHEEDGVKLEFTMWWHTKQVKVYMKDELAGKEATVKIKYIFHHADKYNDAYYEIKDEEGYLSICFKLDEKNKKIELYDPKIVYVLNEETAITEIYFWDEKTTDLRQFYIHVKKTTGEEVKEADLEYEYHFSDPNYYEVFKEDGTSTYITINKNNKTFEYIKPPIVEEIIPQAAKKIESIIIALIVSFLGSSFFYGIVQLFLKKGKKFGKLVVDKMEKTNMISKEQAEQANKKVDEVTEKINQKITQDEILIQEIKKRNEVDDKKVAQANELLEKLLPDIETIEEGTANEETGNK